MNAGIAALPGIKTTAEYEPNYFWCLDFLGGEDERKIASNVYVVRVPGPGLRVGIRLYQTTIIMFYPDGTFSVDNGGFNTLTTAYRLTQFTPEGWTFHHGDKQLWGSYHYLQGHGPLTHEVKLNP
jgi:hypothetical protein